MAQSSFWESVLNRRMLICVFTGFTSGLPLYIIFSLVQAWLAKGGVSLKDIGYFYLLTLPYNIKFLWAPLADRYVPPFLGRRRSWLLVSQITLFVVIAAMGFYDPKQSLTMIALLVFLVSLFGATQDIVIDAYRREILPDNELGLGNSIHINAYRISGLVPGSLAFILADHLPWDTVFIIVAAFMFAGIGMTLVVSEPEILGKPRNLKEAVVEPFKEFIGRKGWKLALYMVAFIFLYKIGDNMATALATPFYLDMGFTMTQIGVVAKMSALWAMVIGGMLGGLLMIKIGINRALWLFGVVQMVTIAGFVMLSLMPSNLTALAVVVAMEYLGVGLGTAAFVAFIARETNPKYTAFQLALFTSLAAVPRTFANSSVGVIVETVGWTNFFIFCTIIAIPGMLLLFKVAPWNEKQDATAYANTDNTVRED